MNNPTSGHELWVDGEVVFEAKTRKECTDEAEHIYFGRVEIATYDLNNVGRRVYTYIDWRKKKARNSRWKASPYTTPGDANKYGPRRPTSDTQPPD